MKQSEGDIQSNRRSFLKKGALTAGAAIVGAGLFGAGKVAFSQESGGSLTRGDIAILRFLAAAELIESDLWTQYAELGGLTPGQVPVEVNPNQPMNGYQAALSNLDPDGPQYITSNTVDEISHADFLNGYLESKGADPVNFDEFLTLQGSQATGAQDLGRLTNLMHLNVDTSWFIRYRSATNPDFGATFPQAINISDRTAIPRTNADFGDANHIQVIANTAAFHFGYIEQGGSSLYAALSQKVSSLEVLKITLGIGGGSRSLSGVGRFCRQRSPTACGTRLGPRPDVSQLFHKRTALPTQPDLPCAVRIHQRGFAPLLGDSAK
jgi:hypothetical protein